MKTVDRFTHTVMEQPDARIVLSDGVSLSARIWRPVDSDTAPVPAILEYLPYRKRDGTAARDAMNHPYFAGHGYACIRVDMRGCGESGGLMEDEYTAQEQDDCLEVLRWIADQDWCTGAIGMIGISWGGFNGLQVACRQPPELKAVVSIAATVDRYADDIHYKGGCMLVENFGWAAQMLSYSSRPPDPALVGPEWRETWLTRLNAQPHLAERWFEHQTRDAYWKHGSVCEDYARVQCPVLAVGGMADGYMNFVTALVENLTVPVKGIIGPWVHLYPNFAVPEPRIGFLQECLRWWDRWLKGIETGVEGDPALRVYRREFDPPHPTVQQRSGRWVSAPAWPSPDVAGVVFPLDHGRLCPPGSPVPRRTLRHRSPQDVGLRAGEYFAWQGPDQPDDQRDEDSRSMTFDMPVGKVPLEIMGRPELRLTVASDQRQAHIAVRLNEVRPDGTSLRVSYGVLNLSQRRGAEELPASMPAGGFDEATVRLDFTCHRFTPGNTVRVSVSSAYWPLIWPDPAPVELSVETGTSVLWLPVWRDAGRPVPAWSDPEIAPPLKLKELRPMQLNRKVVEDCVGRTRVLEVDYDMGRYEDPDHGLITGTLHRERYSIHPDDPLSARMETHWTQELSRSGWDVRTETRSTLTADADAFHLTADIDAYEDGARVFRKTFKKTVPRRFV